MIVQLQLFSADLIIQLKGEFMLEKELKDLEGDFHCCEVDTVNGELILSKKYKITQAQRDFLRTVKMNQMAAIEGLDDTLYTRKYKDQEIAKVQAGLDAIG